ncbi:hypothetical protein HDU85_006668 [Gaertneriomyces sp. JEL0708]|nr:hypothetical protein HDU85_006668 [Gaertneriomyces sp. JEL0708]
MFTLVSRPEVVMVNLGTAQELLTSPQTHIHFLMSSFKRFGENTMLYAEASDLGAAVAIEMGIETLMVVGWNQHQEGVALG